MCQKVQLIFQIFATSPLCALGRNWSKLHTIFVRLLAPQCQQFLFSQTFKRHRQAVWNPHPASAHWLTDHPNPQFQEPLKECSFQKWNKTAWKKAKRHEPPKVIKPEQAQKVPSPILKQAKSLYTGCSIKWKLMTGQTVLTPIKSRCQASKHRTIGLSRILCFNLGKTWCRHKIMSI